MRKLWLRSLALSLGLAVTGAHGQEGVWRGPHSSGASNSPPSAVALGKPIAIATSRPNAPVASSGSSASPAPAPAVTLGRPVATSSRPVQDANITQVAFTPAQRDPRAPIARGAAPDNIPARPMPLGPNRGGVAMPVPGMHSWRTGGEGIVASTVSRNPADLMAAPPPVGGGTTLTAPTPVPPMAGGPALSPGLTPQPGTLPSPTMTPPPGAISSMPGAISTTPGILSGPGVITTPGVVPGPTGPFPGPTILSGPGAPGIPSLGDNCCSPNGLGYCDSGCPTGGCATGGCGWGGCCPGEPRFVLGAEFLLWWLAGDKTPPLAVQGQSVTDPNSYANTLNSTGSVLYGGKRKADNARPGGRLYGQYWFSDDHCWGIDSSGFFLGNADDGRFAVSGNGLTTSIGRPFINETPNTLDVGGRGYQEVAGPSFNGTLNIDRQSNLWGADINLRRNLCCCDWFRLDLLVGARALGLDESLNITENLYVRVPPTGSTDIRVGDRFIVNDRFSTQNRFYGGQIGADGEMRYGPFSLGVRAKLALGSSQQQVHISGSTTKNSQVLTNSSGGTGGLLTQSGVGPTGERTNIGSYTRTMFGIVPEVGATLGYDIFDWWRITAGYNFFYWNSVARPGEQIDPRVNFNYAPGGKGPAAPNPGTGPTVPAFDMKSSDMFVHGITFGMEFRY